jgi:hypothetical protein
MLCSAKIVLLFSFSLNNLIASTNTQLGATHLVSKNSVSEISNQVGLNLIDYNLFNKSNNGITNQPQLDINMNRGQNISKFLRAIFRFLRICSSINQECIPSFFSWIWSLITNPFTWVVGLIIFFVFCKS